MLIAEGHDLVRLGLRALLEAYRPLEVVAEASTVASAVTASVQQRPSLVVTARTLRDGTGVDVCREVRARVPEARVVILSDGHADADAVRDACGVGALGYLSRRMGAQNLCRTLHDLAAGGTTMAPPVRLRERARAEPGLLALTAQEHRVLELVARGKTNKEMAAGEPALDPRTTRVLLAHLRRQPARPRDGEAALTETERRVLTLVAAGKTNREIGLDLALSVKTVKNRLGHAFSKLRVTRRAEAAVLFTVPGASPDDDLPGAA